MDRPSELQLKLLEDKSISEDTKEQIVQEFKDVNRKVCEVNQMKTKNRVEEQMKMVSELKGEFGSYSSISKIAGISKKTVIKWCSEKKENMKKRVELSNLRRLEYEQFLSQDTISFEHPCKKYAGKRFL